MAGSIGTAGADTPAEHPRTRPGRGSQHPRAAYNCARLMRPGCRGRQRSVADQPVAADPEGRDRMTTEEVRFFNAGATIAGTLKLPDRRVRSLPGGRPGPGLAGPPRRQELRPLPRWPARGGRRRAGLRLPRLRRLQRRPHLPALHRPHGPGRGLPRRGHLPPHPAGDRPQADWRLRLRRDRRRQRHLRGALDPRVQVVVAQLPIADGRDWLHRMRREHEWLDFLEAIKAAGRHVRRHRRADDGLARARGSWWPPRSARPRR